MDQKKTVRQKGSQAVLNTSVEDLRLYREARNSKTEMKKSITNLETSFSGMQSDLTEIKGLLNQVLRILTADE